MMGSNFFDSNIYFVDENVSFLKFENSYQIFNDKGKHIGYIKQKLDVGQKIARFLLRKSMVPFLLEIKDLNNNTLATISRGWTFFMSTVIVKDEQDQIISTIQQKFSLVKPTFKLSYASGIQFTEIEGDWKAWNFSIKNEGEQEIGVITKKWAGNLKERFTSADKYMVSLNALQLKRESKIAILSSAMCIDMILKENNS
jgi:uncharacterized protein YxjI